MKPLPITLQALAEKLGATVARGDATLSISGVGNLETAGAAEVAPFSDPKYQAQLEKTRAGAVLAKTEPAKLPASAALLLCPDPEIAFITAIAHFFPESAERAGIDARAVIEPDVTIGAGAYVGPFAVIRTGSRVGARAVIQAHAVIGRNCTIGDDSRLFSHTVLYDGTKIGNRVTIHSGTVLGADGFGYKFRGGKYIKVPQVGTVEIGDDVEIGANVCIDRGALDATTVGNGTKIDNLVQIGHGVRVGNHCVLCGQSALAGSAGMGDYAILGGNAGVADHVFIGKGARAAAKAGIGKDVAPGTEVFGLYADEAKNAFKQLAAYRRLPDLVERVRALERELEALKKGNS
jgi:UDP-3-O-[3-hydroxymyristoyl] glucosamine N-acyltransferase